MLLVLSICYDFLDGLLMRINIFTEN